MLDRQVSKPALSSKIVASGVRDILYQFPYELKLTILNRALGTTGHVGTWVLDPNASYEPTSTVAGEILLEQVSSLKEESSRL